MAVLYFLADGLPLGGVTTYIISLAGTLQQAGHKVTILVQEGGRENLSPQWPAGVVLETVTVTPWDTRAALTRKVKRHLIQKGAEVVFFNNCYYADAYLLRGTAMRGIFIVHGSSPQLLYTFKKEGVFCRDIVAPTPALALRFRKAFPQHRVHCIPHGTVVPAAQPLKEELPFKILYLGRLSPEKGAANLPAILKPFLQEEPESSVTITGSPIEHPDLALALQEAFAPYKEQVIFTGPLHGAQVTTALREAHVLLMPSAEEAFGLAAIEGAAWGAVPVVSLLPGVTDFLFQQGEEAFLCLPNDLPAFSTALKTLCRQRVRRKAMAQAAFQKVQQCFSIAAMTAAYDQLLLLPATPIWPSAATVKERLFRQAFGTYRKVLFLKVRKAWANPDKGVFRNKKQSSS